MRPTRKKRAMKPNHRLKSRKLIQTAMPQPQLHRKLLHKHPRLPQLRQTLNSNKPFTIAKNFARVSCNNST